jgi:hypothetical protein
MDQLLYVAFLIQKAFVTVDGVFRPIAAQLWEWVKGWPADWVDAVTRQVLGI